VGQSKKIGPEIFGDAGISLDHESSELTDSVRNGIAEMHKRWNDRLVWNTLDIVKEHVSGRLEVFIAIDLNAGIDFEVAPSAGAGVQNLILDHPSSPVREVHQFNALNTRGLCDGQEDFVFLCVVQLSKPVERFPATFRVNCKLNEEVDRRLVGCFYSFARGFEIDPVVSGWKFRVPIPGPAIEADKFPCCVIERGAEIMDGIAENEGQARGQRRIKDDLEKEGLILTATVDMNSVTVVLCKGLQSCLKVMDVLIGPFDFQRRAFEYAMREHDRNHPQARG